MRGWQAADRILRSGRRPTVEGVRELLGGGSPNSVTAYMNDWYRELGGPLAAAETPLAGFPAEAVSMMTELWRLAASEQASARDSDKDVVRHVQDAERDALRAEARALPVLNQELQRHRASAEQSLTGTRALPVRREAALDEERAQAATREQELAQVRLELEVARERQRLAPARSRSPTARAPRKRATGKAANARSGGKQKPAPKARLAAKARRRPRKIARRRNASKR